MRRTLLLGALLAAVWAALALPASSFAAVTQPQLGETRNWLGLDNILGGYYRKPYVLRGLGPHIEVWVATGFSNPGGRGGSYGLEFPGNTRGRGRGFDCRNAYTEVTDQQVQYLIDQYESNILPKEAAAFATLPPRDGTKPAKSIARDPRFQPQGPADHLVVLIDNVRDDNFYSFDNAARLSYIQGFFSTTLNTLFDRNFLTLDPLDLAYILGPNPQSGGFTGPLPPIGTLTRMCIAPTAGQRFEFEGAFAHEYQHLLESYSDPNEVSWVNEGLSMFAESLTGYSNPLVAPPDPNAQGHTWGFLGFRNLFPGGADDPLSSGGPENSLTLWGDQNDQRNEILSDYGAAYTFMLLLNDRYGLPFMSALHTDPGVGLEGLQNVLTKFNVPEKAQDVFHDWAAMVALDQPLDQGRTLSGGDAAQYTTKSLNATINWDNSEAYSHAGAPPNGSDYVRLRDAGGKYLSAGQVNSVSFKGDTTYPAHWRIDSNPPGHSGNAAIYSGTGNSLDEAVSRQVTVPAGSPALTFASRWNIEQGWDFGFVQVVGADSTKKSLACTDTTSTQDPDAADLADAGQEPWKTIKDSLPGFTGDSGGWKTETCSLAAYAGQTVTLYFRYITDPASAGTNPDVTPGWWIDDISVAGTSISDGSSLSGFNVSPRKVANWLVRLVGWNTTDKSVPAFIGSIKLDASFAGTLTGADLRAIIGDKADLVAAIVTLDDPTEAAVDPANYSLTVNGVAQPGGS